MTDYTITITDYQDRGVTAAREQHNATLSDGNDGFADNAAYIQHVMSSAATSYANSAGIGAVPSADFLLRIPPAKYAAIYAAQGDDPNIAALIARVKSLSVIRVNEAEAQQGAAYLVAAGYLTQQDADALLAY